MNIIAAAEANSAPFLVDFISPDSFRVSDRSCITNLHSPLGVLPSDRKLQAAGALTLRAA
jgi:hypothetical protein